VDSEDLEEEVLEEVALAVPGNLELIYLREMKLKVRTSLAGALLVLFAGVLSFQTVHQLTEHSHELVSEHEHEHEEEQCQFCAVKALPYLPVEILNFSFRCDVIKTAANSVYVSPFSDSVFVEQSGRGPPQG